MATIRAPGGADSLPSLPDGEIDSLANTTDITGIAVLYNVIGTPLPAAC